MTTSREPAAGPRAPSACLLLALGLCGAALAASPAGAQPDGQRIARQIRIMEKVIDQVLIESQHALVRGGPNCRGLRLEGYGVLFAVELSPILLGDEILHFHFKEDGSYDVTYGDRERQVIEGRLRATGRRDEPSGGKKGSRKDDDEDDRDYDDERDDDDDNDNEDNDNEDNDDRDADWPDLEFEENGSDGREARPPRRFEEWLKRSDADETRAERLRQEALDRVRHELVAVLRDYGHTISDIPADEYVSIAIFPSDLDWRDPATRTLIQVKRHTIDAFNDSKLSAEEFLARVEVLTQ